MFIRPNTGRITSRFQKSRLDPVGGKVTRPHWGVDFGKDGSPSVIAAADGKVTLAKVNGGFGNCVYVNHVINGKVYDTVYAHLSHISVKLGQTVKQGQQIGIKGSTGNSTGVHLHFELTVGGRWNNKYTHNVDPLLYITDPDVKELQELLNKVGFKLIEDGITGPSTETAVKAFQKSNGLTVDGIAGAATLDKLRLASKPKLVASVDKPVATVSNPKPVVKEVDDIMFNPGSETLHKEMKEFLEKARKSGAFSSTAHEEKAKNKNLERDTAIGLIAAYLNRTIK